METQQLNDNNLVKPDDNDGRKIDDISSPSKDGSPVKAEIRKIPIASWMKSTKMIEDTNEQTGLKKKVYDFIESTPVIIFMMVVTVYALFGDDVRQVSVDINNDDIFYILTLIWFFLFAIEIIIALYWKPDYRWGFFFWLDFISTISLLLDVGWISNLVMNTEGAGTNAKNAASFAKTARASRIGTRAGRVVRIIRLIRLIRIVKLYKASKQAETKKKESKERERRRLEINRKLAEEKLRDEQHLSESFGSFQEDSIDRNFDESKIGLTDNKETPLKDNGNQQNSQQAMKIDNSVKNDKIDKSIKGVGTQSRQSQPMSSVRDLDEVDEKDILEETDVGKKLSDLTTKRVIILILSIMISIPIFSTDTYFSEYTNNQAGMQNILFLFNLNPDYTKNVAFQAAWTHFITSHTESTENHILKKINFIQRFDASQTGINEITDQVCEITKTSQYLVASDMDNLRVYEIKSVVEPEDIDSIPDLSYYLIAYFDQSKEYDLNGYLGIGRTIFVWVVLVMSAMLFSKDANELVLIPLEQMLLRVKKLSKNPLNPNRIEEDYEVLWEGTKPDPLVKKNQKIKNMENFETTILDKVIVKMGVLLCLGFGKHGSKVITKMIQPNGEIDPLISGERVMAIFGYWSLKDFTQLTETLQEGIMVFINEIADIVHTNVDLHSGYPNKSIGDSFILIWRFDQDDCKENDRSQSFEVDINSYKANWLVDLAVLSLIKIGNELILSRQLEKYRETLALTQKQSNYHQINASHNQINLPYTIKMGFGLHCGWAIEGAVGSEFKIDTLYLSPHANVASKLDSLTKEYDVSILVSGEIAKNASKHIQKLLRHIDWVKVPILKEPMDVLTVDLDTSQLFYSTFEKTKIVELYPSQKKAKLLEMKNQRENLRKSLFSREVSTDELLFKNYEIDSLRNELKYNDEFYEKWRLAMKGYLQGDWKEAKDHFESTLIMYTDPESGVDYWDGPSKFFLNFLRENNYTPPSNWEGMRVLS